MGIGHKGHVLIAAPVHPLLTAGLESAGYECIVREQITQQEAMELMADCSGVVTSTRLLVNKELIDAAPKLAWIARMGSGMEVIDVVYALQKNISCFSSPDGISNAVGEHALGMLLSVLHRISVSNAELRQGVWLREENRGEELEGKTIGIIGFGHCGRAFAKKLMGFDVTILAYDKYRAGNFPDHVTQARWMSMILEQADVVSFHVPQQEDTYHYFNDDFLYSMNRPFILINTSRGKVVDTMALYKGLMSGKVTGACIDVYEEEPLMGKEGTATSEVIAMPNVIATPHIAGYTHNALYKMSRSLLSQITGSMYQ